MATFGQGTLSYVIENNEKTAGPCTEKSLTLCLPKSTSCPGLTCLAVKRYCRSREWIPPQTSESISSVMLANRPNYLFLTPNDIPFLQQRSCETEHCWDDCASTLCLDKGVDCSEVLSSVEEIEKSDVILNAYDQLGRQFITHERLTSHRRVHSDSTMVQYDKIRLDSNERISPSGHRPNTNLIEQNQGHKLMVERGRHWYDEVPLMGGWHLPRPSGSADESLAAYISSGHFSRHQAQLDKENAHLILAELIIQLSTKEHNERLERRINAQHLHDLIGDTSFKSFNNSSNTLQTSSIVGGSSEKIMDLHDTSAESKALCLLQCFDKNNCPKASEMNKLITRDDVDLAFTTFDLVSPNEIQDVLMREENNFASATELRGSLLWAPPRPQLILQVHKPINRDVQMSLQNWQCAGCGMKVEAKYAKTFRFCYYFGKLFCTICHTNQSHIIPASIVTEWNFKEYPVSDFAHTMLLNMLSEPLFNLPGLNPNMIKKNGKLKNALDFRFKTKDVFPYISACRLATGIQKEVEEIGVFEDSQIFSIRELSQIKNGNYVTRLKVVLLKAIDHIENCELCLARGFLCELCRSDRVIFPFKSGVVQCLSCRACFHTRCKLAFSPVGCLRCDRIALRKAANLTETV